MSRMLKKYLPISEQIEKLKNRGLIVEDEEFAEMLLERVNYYRFTGYLHDFRKASSDSYIEGVSFNKIAALYEFDVKLTRLLMFVLEDIEETFKTRFAYTLSSEFPNEPQIYTKREIYRDERELKKSKKKIAASKKNNRNLPFHHRDMYRI